MAINKYYIGFLIFVVLTYSVYISLPDQVRIDVQKTKTLISVYEDNKRVLGATEYLNLFDGTKKMRASSRTLTNQTEGNLITITRTATWKDNITTVHDYTFDPTISKVELFPIEEKLTCSNCQGKIVHFEYRDILYTGITREASSPESFGHNIKIEWQDGYDWARVYQQKVASDKLIIRYKPKSNYEVFKVRLFDPPSPSLKAIYGEATTTRLKFKVRSLNDKNVTPVNQTIDIPAFNLTNNGSASTAGGLWVRLNETLPDGFLITINVTTPCSGSLFNDTTARNIYTPVMVVNETISIYVCLNLSNPTSFPGNLKFLFNITT